MIFERAPSGKLFSNTPEKNRASHGRTAGRRDVMEEGGGVLDATPGGPAAGV